MTASIEKPHRNWRWRLATSLACGVAAAGTSIAYFKELDSPTTPAKIATCVRAIGHSAFYQGDEPSPQCDDFDQYFPPKQPGAQPMNATGFQAEANSALSDQGSADTIELVVVMAMGAAGAYGGRWAYNAITDHKHEELAD